MKKVLWGLSILLLIVLVGYGAKELFAQKSKSTLETRKLIEQSREELREIQEWLKGQKGTQKLQREAENLLKEAEKLLEMEKQLAAGRFTREAKKLNKKVKKLHRKVKNLREEKPTREAILFEKPPQRRIESVPSPEPQEKTAPKTFAFKKPPEEEISEKPPPSPEGTIEFLTPQKMVVGETKKIEVRLSRETLQPLFEGIHPGMRRTREVLKKIYDVMTVSLDYDEEEFKIISAPQDPLETIEETGYAAWVWYIKALKGGQNMIVFQVGGKINHDVFSVVQEKVIQVEVGPSPPFLETVGDFWQKHWQWFIGILITAILGPIIVYLVQKKCRRKKE